MTRVTALLRACLLSRHAQQLTHLDAAAEHHALAQFQGVLVLIARMVTVGTLERAAAEQLLEGCPLPAALVDSTLSMRRCVAAF